MLHDKVCSANFRVALLFDQLRGVLANLLI